MPKNKGFLEMFILKYIWYRDILSVLFMNIVNKCGRIEVCKCSDICVEHCQSGNACIWIFIDGMGGAVPSSRG